MNGQLRALETKPMMAAVWPNLNVVEGSLPTAISKLRQVLGDQGRLVITAVHRIGYRIGVPVTQRAGPPPPRLSFALRAGETVPGRPQWVLDRLLNGIAERDVWLARHEKTGECRVFKFATTAERLKALRREAAISRLLHAALGERADFVRVNTWNFETRPYFIESPYGGQKGFGANSAQAMAMMGEVAFCLIVAGNAAEAAPLIDAINPKALSELGAGPDFPAQLDVMRADIALSAHDIPRARALLQHPAQVFDRPDADPYVRRWVARLLASTKE